MKKVDAKIPENSLIFRVSDIFKIFGDSTRIKILYSLFDGEVCVNDICKSVNMTQSAVSHQLRILKQSRLVSSRKEGKEVYYLLDDDHVKSILDVGMSHIKEGGNLI